MSNYRIVATLFITSLALNGRAEPSFYCGLTDASSVETHICNSHYFSELDIRLAKVFTEAAVKTVGEALTDLRAEQRRWIKDRNDCWKSPDLQSCIEHSYNHRTAELQARFQLVDTSGPLIFRCNNDTNNTLVVTFYNSTPLSLNAQKDGAQSFMLSSDLSKNFYSGQTEYFVGDTSAGTVVWGYDGQPLSCKVVVN